MPQLKELLFDEYGGLREGKITKSGPAMRIIVDDRGPDDLDQRGQLMDWFCAVTVYVESREAVSINLKGRLPVRDNFRHWVAKHRGELLEDEGFSLSLIIGKGQQRLLDELASFISQITSKSRWCAYPLLRFACPRTASSLIRLRIVLDRAWQAQ